MDEEEIDMWAQYRKAEEKKRKARVYYENNKERFRRNNERYRIRQQEKENEEFQKRLALGHTEYCTPEACEIACNCYDCKKGDEIQLLGPPDA